jgi:hypothetical protein
LGLVVEKKRWAYQSVPAENWNPLTVRFIDHQPAFGKYFGRTKSMTNRQRSSKQPPYPADKARGAEIILQTRLQRIVFVAGLLGVVIFGGLLIIFSR